MCCSSRSSSCGTFRTAERPVSPCFPAQHHARPLPPLLLSRARRAAPSLPICALGAPAAHSHASASHAAPPCAETVPYPSSFPSGGFPYQYPQLPYQGSTLMRCRGARCCCAVACDPVLTQRECCVRAGQYPYEYPAYPGPYPHNGFPSNFVRAQPRDPKPMPWPIAGSSSARRVTRAHARWH